MFNYIEVSFIKLCENVIQFADKCSALFLVFSSLKRTFFRVAMSAIFLPQVQCLVIFVPGEVEACWRLEIDGVCWWRHATQYFNTTPRRIPPRRLPHARAAPIPVVVIPQKMYMEWRQLHLNLLWALHKIANAFKRKKENFCKFLSNLALKKNQIIN